MVRTGRSETTASMIQNGELSGKVGRDPGPAHRSGHGDCLPARTGFPVSICCGQANAARVPIGSIENRLELSNCTIM